MSPPCPFFPCFFGKKQGKPPKKQGFLSLPDPQKSLEKKGKMLKKKEILARRKNKEFQKNKERKDRAEAFGPQAPESPKTVWRSSVPRVSGQLSDTLEPGLKGPGDPVGHCLTTPIFGDTLSDTLRGHIIKLSGPYRAMRAAMRCERRCVVNAEMAMRCDAKILAMRVLVAEILCDALPRCENTSDAMPRCRPLSTQVAIVKTVFLENGVFVPNRWF